MSLRSMLFPLAFLGFGGTMALAKSGEPSMLAVVASFVMMGVVYLIEE